MGLKHILTDLKLFNSANGVRLIPLKENVKNVATYSVKKMWDDLSDEVIDPVNFTRDALELHGLQNSSVVILLDSMTFNRLIIHPYCSGAYRYFVTNFGRYDWINGLKFNYELTGRMFEYYGHIYVESKAKEFRFDIYTYEVVNLGKIEDQINVELQALKASYSNWRRNFR